MLITPQTSATRPMGCGQGWMSQWACGIPQKITSRKGGEKWGAVRAFPVFCESATGSSFSAHGPRGRGTIRSKWSTQEADFDDKP
jgi:hypothetical protein